MRFAWPARRSTAVKLLAIAVLALSATPTSVNAQTTQLERDLVASLEQVRVNQCPAKMAPLLAETCSKSIDYLRAAISAHGEIKDLKFMGTQIAQGTQLPASVFDVKFSNGTMTWLFAEDSFGQITVFWTPG
jgi:hypothetical protein